MNKKLMGATLAATAAIAFAAAPATSFAKGKTAKEVACYHVNACSGKGMCKGAKNACGGHNACKTKGKVMMSKKACDAIGGSTEAS